MSKMTLSFNQWAIKKMWKKSITLNHACFEVATHVSGQKWKCALL